MKNIDIFKGKRIHLCPVVKDDAPHLARWTLDGAYLRHYDTAFAMPRSAAYFEKLIEEDESAQDTTLFAIRTLDDDKLIGTISLHTIEWNNKTCILSIGIGEADYRNGGYGTEALRLILAFAFFELNMHRVGLEVISYNYMAKRAYEKVGFKVEGTIRECVDRDGEKYDKILMGVLRDELLL